MSPDSGLVTVSPGLTHLIELYLGVSCWSQEGRRIQTSPLLRVAPLAHPLAEHLEGEFVLVGIGSPLKVLM